jgi:riboflavin kinase / FMN adenylyltransferase
MTAQRPGGRPPAAVTIGVFDGVHRGHQALLGRVVAAARRVGGRAVVITFRRHPLAVLNPSRCPPAVTGAEERAALLKSNGIDAVIGLEFDAQTAALTAREFLEQVLLPHYDLKVLVVGPDFAMGRGRAGDPRALAELGKELGFTVEIMPPVAGAGGERISSTQLRNAIRTGDLPAAREQLGRDVAVRGRVVPGAGRGRGLGAPTANLAIDPERLLPADGVYAALVRVESETAGDGLSAPEQPAVVNIGLAPTFGGNERRVEVHLLDVDQDLVGAMLQVRLVERLRGEERFESPAALKAQIAADVARARGLIAERLAAESSPAAARGAAPTSPVGPEQRG